MKAARYLLLASLVACLPAFRAAAAKPADAEPLRAAPLGPIVEAPDGKSEMELVRFDESVTARLQTLAPEETLRVDDWPVSPGRRAQVVLRRFDVYAPDAKIVVIEDGREIEVPRSRTVFFMGSRIDGSGRFAIGLDPDTGTFQGSLSEDGVLFEIRPRQDGSRIHRIAARSAYDPEGTPDRSWTCGQEELPLDEGGPTPSNDGAHPVEASWVQPLAPATKVAVIAVETDNEFMNLKFANNAANATTYIANLFSAHNVIYERDANVRLLQGYTILRPSTTADPYLQSGTGNADSAKLYEFRDYWNLHYAPVKRALAMLLSGKQASSSSASGIAFVPGLCGTNGYSFNQVFKFAEQTAGSDIGVVAHEVGHNFSSPHTHCYADPKPDTCYNGESCYTGSTACPTLATYNGVSARGTLMSYCHVLGGCDKADVFHTSSLSRYVNGAITGASCIFVIGAAAPTITNVSPATGLLAGGTVLTITGTNFVNGPPTVAFVELPSNDVFGTPSSKAAASVTFNSSTQLTVTTPSATNLGAVDVVVMNPDFQTATRASGFTYSATPPAPTVTAISPNTGSTAGGTSVTITGTGFAATPSVVIGGSSATAEVFVNSTTLTATLPAHAAGLVNVVVTNPDAQSGTLTNGYAYLPPPSASRYYVLTPCRLFDTRNTTILAANETRTFDVSGLCGVPDIALALTVNATVTGSGAAGELRFFPGNGLSPNPPASTLFYAAGKTRANNSTIRLSTDGTATLKVQNVSAAAVHFILDVSGYYRVAP